MDQEEILRKCNSDNPEERRKAVDQLINIFESFSDKKQVWEDLHRLTSDEDTYVRWKMIAVLKTFFQDAPEKKQAWEDLHRLISDENDVVRLEAIKVLKTNFQCMPDKEQAWEDIVKLTSDEESKVKWEAVATIKYVFKDVKNKTHAWEDIVKLTSDNDNYVRWGAVATLGTVAQHVPDKKGALEDLCELTLNGDRYVRCRAAEALATVAQCVPDKKQMFDDLYILISDKDKQTRLRTLEVLGTAFQYVPYKGQVWEDLHRLTSDKDGKVRKSVAEVLGTVFQYVSDKQQAWEDLHRLISDENDVVRLEAIKVLKTNFQCMPDKEQAWEDIVKLTSDQDSNVRQRAAGAVGTVFQYVPDKEQAWQDLIKLTSDQDSNVRQRAAGAVGTVFQYVPDKEQAWQDLIKLTSVQDSDVRVNAYHSLGRISIYKASQSGSEEAYLEELENSIQFFEKAAKESSWGNNPSRFCLPFYRSFYAIISAKKREAKGEVEKYLLEAKVAIGDSHNKKLLFNTVENLANALKEVQNLENIDLEAKKGELSFYRKYCEQAAELMKNTEKTAPYATATMIKGLPILDRNLKFLLEEIQEKAKTACQVSKGTNTEEIACAISREVQKWEIGSQEEITLYVESFIFTLESKIPRLPENEHIFNMINESKNQKDLKKLLERTSELIEIIPEITIDPERMKPTIGIITALPKEYAAISVLLENKNDKYKIPGSGAGRRYCLGEILSEEENKHSLVLANAGMGNNIAATRASLLLEHFPNVKSILMVGIAGGVPNSKKVDDHVRLGDIVVSNENGVIQYDLIKQEIQEITHRNPPRPPSASLLEAVKYLEVEEIIGNRPWEKYIDQSLSIIKTIRPSEDKDVLYCSDIQEEIIQHPEDPKRIKGQPRVFTGPIASANILQKDPKARDKLRDKFGVKAIEMEASGIADATWNHEVGYLVVRGICDYCDSHKNDDWQQYAAVVAAAYTRALIESMP